MATYSLIFERPFKINQMRLSFLLISFFTCQIINAQNQITLQPNAEAGTDALIHELSSRRNTNYGLNIQFSAHAGTTNGTLFLARSMTKFDLTSIPMGMQIDSAFLSLYAYDRTNGFAMHRNSSKPNGAWLRRITSPWDEMTVTWNNAPSTTTQNQVALSPSTSSTQDYLNVNLTGLLQDIHQNTNYGFQFVLQNENYYCTLNFFSSDAVDSTKRPKLVIYYSPVITSLQEKNQITSAYSIFPNPSKGSFSVQQMDPSLQLNSVSIYDIQGRFVQEFLTTSKLHLITTNLPEDIYLLKLQGEKRVFFDQLIVQ